MRRIGIEEQAVARLHLEKLVAVTVDHLAFEHIEKLHALVLEGREDVGIGRQCDQIGLDDDAAGIVVDMAEQIILMAGARAAPFELDALACLDEDGIARFLEAAKKAVSGTPSARDRDCSVVSDGEMLPFSIFDSMPSEMPVAAARSVTVMPSFLR